MALFDNLRGKMAKRKDIVQTPQPVPPPPPKSEAAKVVRINVARDIAHAGVSHKIILSAIQEDGGSWGEAIFVQLAPSTGPVEQLPKRNGDVAFEITGVTGKGVVARFHLLKTGRETSIFLKGPDYDGANQTITPLPDNAGFWQKLTHLLKGGSLS